jgi:hypothetical protein
MYVHSIIPLLYLYVELNAQFFSLILSNRSMYT